MTLVLDTGPVYSSIDRSDPDHARVVDALRTTPRPHLIVQPVLVEVDYWLRKLLDASAFQALASDIAAGRYELLCLDPQDVVRSAELEAVYEGIGFVDASIVAACERLDIGTVLTFDHRDLGRVRPAHRPHLEILPR